MDHGPPHGCGTLFMRAAEFQSFAARSGVRHLRRFLPHLLVPWLSLSACSVFPGDPAPDPQVERILGDDRYTWMTLETENTHVHFPAGSFAEAQAGSLPGRAEGARETVLRRLALSDYDDVLHLFYVDSREDMANLTGSPVTGYSYFNDHAAVVVFNEDWRAFELHELTHTVTLGTWADPAGPAVVEGLATYVDGVCGGYENGRIARTFLDRGLLLPLEVLAEEFRQQNDLIAYLQAGTIVEFAVDRGGPETIRRLWNQGLGASPDLLGMSSDVFHREFQDWLALKYAPISDNSLEAIRAGGCGITPPPAG